VPADAADLSPADRLPTLAELRAGAQVVRIPLTTRFRGIDVREVLLLQGPAGWGEWAPFLEYGPAESARWLAAAVEAAWVGWPQPLRGSVPVNAIVPAVLPDRAAAAVRESGGCRTAKVKVAEPGQALAEDVARVAAVRAALDEGGPGGRLRVDANGGWSVPEAATALSELAAFDLEYAEQPCATLVEQAELRRLTDVPLAADEGVRKAADPEHVAGLREAADLVVLKVSPLGGVARALKVADACALPAVVSSALDTSVGLAAGVALAAALPALPYACGLGSGRLLVADVVVERLLPAGGMLPVARPVPDPDRLAELAAPERAAWWDARLAAAYEIMLAT
jgi:O-succinylbenzoate synthase